MSEYFESYLTVGAFAALGAVLVLGMLGVASVLRPSNPSKTKNMTYECGVDPVGSGWSQSYVRYYVFGLLFVIFDVEAVFIFPWAINLEQLGLSPQCGFASTVAGNPITIDDEKAKLSLIVEVADKVWG